MERQKTRRRAEERRSMRGALPCAATALALYLTVGLTAISSADGPNDSSSVSFREFVASHRVAVAIGLVELSRKIQSRIDQLGFEGVPSGSLINFSLSSLKQLRMITINASADTAPYTSKLPPISCDHLLRLVRYIIADGGSTYYEQKIMDHAIDLDKVDPEVSRQACRNVLRNLSIALDDKEIELLNSIDDTQHPCSTGMALEAGVGSSSGEVSRCRADLTEAE